jgi:ssDNA-binding Zn-finger/Zn-ribbon topoisomerase 1
MERFALEAVDDDEDMAIEAEEVEEAEVLPEEPGNKSGGVDRNVSPRRQVGQIGQVCPICPRCRGPMTRGRAKAGRAKGREFWVCHQYPDCRGLRAIVGGRRRA